MTPSPPVLMTAPALPLGEGHPGERLAQAFQGWPQRTGAVTPATVEAWHQQAPYFLPWAWRALAAGTGPLLTETWHSHIHAPTPMGPWCPAALLLLSHDNGGRVGVDLDPTPSGHWFVWWEDATHVACLACSWQGLAEQVKAGPDALAIACHCPWDPPQPLGTHPLNSDPLMETWIAQQAVPGNAWCLMEPGQALEKDCLVARHPRHPIFWTRP